MITFYIQPDSVTYTKAFMPYKKRTDVFKKINEAIEALKKRKKTYRLCYIEDNNPYTVKTLMFAEEELWSHRFTPRKLKYLIKISDHMYIPKSISRKTTRKRKKRCKK